MNNVILGAHSYFVAALGLLLGRQLNPSELVKMYLQLLNSCVSLQVKISVFKKNPHQP